jgi:hypothetical protein
MRLPATPCVRLREGNSGLSRHDRFTASQIQSGTNLMGVGDGCESFGVEPGAGP